MPDTSLYHLHGVTRSYAGSIALECPDLSISRGCITGISGPNGSGKSTLLKLLAFIDRASTGEVIFDGRPELPFSPGIRHRVTLLPQIPFLMNRSVFENVAYGLRVKRDLKSLESRVADSLERVGLEPEKFAARHRHELSGGEAQRVALAARLILDPEVLILDEPTVSVDAASTHLIRQAILSFAESGKKTVILTSHDGGWLTDVSDEMHYFFRGRLVKRKMALMLFGPYGEVGHGRWVKVGQGEAGIEVPKPPSADAVAALPEEALRFHGSPSAGEVRVDAHVREVTRCAGNEKAQVLLMSQGTPITISCLPELAPEPDSTTQVIYPLSAVHWL